MPTLARAALASELARPLIDSWWIVVAGTCLGLTVGIAGYDLLPSEYRATATLSAEKAGGAGTLREAARSAAVLEEALAGVGEKVVDEAAVGRLRGRISTEFLSAERQTLSVAAGDPTEAAGLANAVAAAVVAPDGPFRLVARAEPPSQPAAPRKLEVYLLGLVIGLVTVVGLPLVRSAINPVICSEAAVETSTGRPVLISIPRVSTQETRADSRRRRLLNAGLSVLSVAVLIVTALMTEALG